VKRDTNYFLSSGEEKTEKSAHIFSKQQQTHKKRKKKRREKRVILFSRLMQIKKEKEKRDERDVRSSSSSSSSPFTVLARCHAQFRHRFFERVSERNFKSSRVSNVMRFYCLSSSPFLVLLVIAHNVLFLRAFSLSLSLTTETNNAL
jgi:hypothetical protein